MNEPKVILSKGAIIERAKDKWDSKGEIKRLMCGKKYQHIFDTLKLKMSPWSNNFEKLTQSQKSILIKGELIRTYDGLSNSQKTSLKKQFGLSSFSSKWYKLTPSDKKLLLNSILNQ
jgi:hypothetical protein